MVGFRRPLVTLIKAGTAVFLFFYLPSCFVYLVSPADWWFMGILAIAFPYLWLLLLALSMTWLFIRKRSAAILFLLLFCGLPIMKNVFSFQRNPGIQAGKKSGQLRLMQWNCNSLPGYVAANSGNPNDRKMAIQFITTYQPDIICIQDFSQTITSYANSNIGLMRDTLGYKYYMYAPHYRKIEPGFNESIGIAIFSKIPITDSGKIYYPGKKVPETIIWAGFDIGGKRLRIATTHLQSMHLSGKIKKDLSPDLNQDSLVILHGSALQKLRYFQPYHVTQSRVLKNFADTCNTAFILTADLNSVPSSYVYNTVVKSGLTDVFKNLDHGFGRTYHSLQPALRIDYIFHNNRVLPFASSLFRTDFSDHDPLIMDFSIR